MRERRGERPPARRRLGLAGAPLLLVALLLLTSGSLAPPASGRGSSHALTGLPYAGTGRPAVSSSLPLLQTARSSFPVRSTPIPEETGPARRSLLLFNNTVLPGAQNASNFATDGDAYLGPAGGLVLLDSPSTSTLEELSTVSMAALWSLAIPSGDQASAYDSANGMVYVISALGNVTEVDPATHSILATYQPLGGGQTWIGATYDAAISSVLITDDTTTPGRLLFFDPASGTVTSWANVGTDPFSSVVDPVTGNIFVVNTLSDNVSVVSGASRQSVAAVTVGSSPTQATYDAALGEIAVLDPGGRDLTLFDASSFAVIGTANVGTSPREVAVDADTGDLAVSNYVSDNISLIDPTTRTSTGQIGGILDPLGLVYDPTAGVHDIGVASSLTNNFTLYNGTLGTPVGWIPLGANPADSVADSDNGDLYVANSEPGSVAVVNPVSFHVVQWIQVGVNPTAIAYDPLLDQIYVADSGSAASGFPGNVTVINGATNTILTTIQTPPQPDDIAYDPVDQEVFIADGGSPGGGFSGDITVLTAATNAVVGSFPISKTRCAEPDGLSYDPPAQSLLVGCEQGSGFGIFDPANDSLTQVVPVGGATSNEQYDPLDGDLFVTDLTLGAISIFNATAYTPVTQISTGIAVPTDLDVDLDDGDVAVAVSAANEVYMINADYSSVTIVQVAHGPGAIGFDPVQGYFVVGCELGGVIVEVPDLQVASFRANPATITLTNSTHFVVSVADGAVSHVLTYTYFDLPSGCGSANSSVLVCTPAVAGTYTVEVLVADHYGKWAYANATLLVNPAPIVRSFTATPSPTGIGVSTQFSVTAGLGTLPYTYAYSGLPAGCSSSSTPTLTCTPTASGTFTVIVSVADADSVAATGTLDLTVAPDPTITSFSATPAETIEGRTTVLRVAASGGAGALSYAYSGLPAGCFSSDTAGLSCDPATGVPPSVDEVSVNVSDALGHWTTDTLSLTVLVPLSITSFSASPNPVDQEATVSLALSIRGGGGQPSIVYLGLPGGCTTGNSTALTCDPSASGTFEVEVEVADHVGEVATAYLNLTVTAVSTTPSYTLFLLAIVGLVVVLVAVTILVRLSKRKREGPGPQSEDGASGEPQAYPPSGPYPGPNWQDPGAVPPGAPPGPGGPPPPWGG
jgi:YVTN family beta-propeller protein